MSYIISDGNGTYLKADYSGQYMPTKNITLAERWDTKLKAANVLKSCISKNLRSRYQIEEIPDPGVLHSIGSAKTPESHRANPCRADLIQECMGDKPDEGSMDEALSSIINGITSLRDAVKATEQKVEELYGKLSTVDKEISDIYHYIEDGKFNAYQGWLVFSLLQNKLKYRRSIKNQIEPLNILLHEGVSSVNVQKALNKASTISQQLYKPRVLTSLFE